MPEQSPLCVLAPVDPTSVNPKPDEAEQSAPWVIRKMAKSMTGRIVMSSYESLRAAGNSIGCLSAWGDSSFLFLPCIRFRDVVVHTVVGATGGIAAVAAPVMDPVSDAVASALGDSIVVEMGLNAASSAVNGLALHETLKYTLPTHSARLETTGVKVLLITLKHKQLIHDAALGFYRSSIHKDTSLFSSVKDYFAVEKGWFSPYLFASARRPIIPRSMKPDIIFCHGPFLLGDYRIGETLLAESALTIMLCDPPPDQRPSETAPSNSSHGHLSVSSVLHRLRTPSPDRPTSSAPPPPPVPRRLVMLLVGLKPHRKLWTTSARPGESVLNYVLCNGCPAIVVPARVGAPLLAWDGMTLEQLWNLALPPEKEKDKMRSNDRRFEGVVDILFEYLSLSVDWARVVIPEESEKVAEESEGTSGAREVQTQNAVRDAITLLVAAAVRTRTSNEVREEIDQTRCGIAIWRIP